jgi:hypothetical protein
VKLPNGQTVAAGEKLDMGNGLRSLADTADFIPTLKTTLISNSKLADAGYITVFDKDEVNVYNSTTTKIVPTMQAVLTGWRDKITGLWQFPLKEKVENQATDTKLMTPNESANITEEIASNVYDLPSTEPVISHLVESYQKRVLSSLANAHGS